MKPEQIREELRRAANQGHDENDGYSEVDEQSSENDLAPDEDAKDGEATEDEEEQNEAESYEAAFLNATSPDLILFVSTTLSLTKLALEKRNEAPLRCPATGQSRPLPVLGTATCRLHDYS